MPKGKIITKKAVDNASQLRKKGMMLFVDREGNVRVTKMNRKGGKRGRKVCR